MSHAGRLYKFRTLSPLNWIVRHGVVLVLGLILSQPAGAGSIIYAIGDSITRGIAHSFNSSDHPASAYRKEGGLPRNLKSYREHLHDALVAPECGADIIWVGAKEERGRIPSHHEGRSGFRVDEILNKTWPDDAGHFSAQSIDGWLATFKPDVVLIHLGTNDLTEGEGAVSTSEEIDELIGRVFQQRPNASVLVANIIPVYGWCSEYIKTSPFAARDISKDVIALAGLIANIVSNRQANGDDIHLVDVNSEFFVEESILTVCGGIEGNPDNMSATNCKQAPDGSGLVPDGVHPNLLGEAFIARQFAEVLINDFGICKVTAVDSQSATEIHQATLLDSGVDVGQGSDTSEMAVLTEPTDAELLDDRPEETVIVVGSSNAFEVCLGIFTLIVAWCRRRN